MAEWSESDAATYRELASVAVPRQEEMLATMLALVPFAASEPVRVIDLAAGEGRLAAACLDCFPHATLTTLDGSESMRAEAGRRLARFGSRARVASFDLASLDWWDQMRSADVVLSSLALHHLNDAKKQYLYKAVADRLPERGAFIIADVVQPAHPLATTLAADLGDRSAHAQAEQVGAPGRADRFVEAEWNHFRFPDDSDQTSAIFHHLVWLKHAGFAAVDCAWMFAGHAVLAAHKQTAWTGAGVSYDAALRSVGSALQA